MLNELAGHGDLAELAPGRLELRLSRGQLLTFVVTPEQWDQVVDMHVGDDFEMYFLELMASIDTGDAFVVVWDTDLCRSTREELPPMPSRATQERWAEYRRIHPNAKVEVHSHTPTLDSG
jgi:hypothetical protein